MQGGFQVIARRGDIIGINKSNNVFMMDYYSNFNGKEFVGVRSNILILGPTSGRVARTLASFIDIVGRSTGIELIRNSKSNLNLAPQRKRLTKKVNLEDMQNTQ